MIVGFTTLLKKKGNMSEKISEVAKEYHANHGNCAFSVMYGYWRSMGKSEAEAMALAESARSFSGGRAPDGTCGALYAAKLIALEQACAVEEYFKNGAKGCTRCKEIRPNAVIPCNRCVELAGEALEALKP